MEKAAKPAETQIETELRLLEKSISEIDTSVCEIVSRLVDVCRPTEPREDVNTDETPKVPLADRLSKCVYRLRASIDTANDLIDRLEL